MDETLKGFLTMKMKWAAGLAALILLSGSVLADSNIPTDEVLKKQFNRAQEGLMQLDSITLRLLDSHGNRATYAAEGDISATEDLYSMVGMAGNYQFMEQTSTKGRPVKFSAMVKAVGTKIPAGLPSSSLCRWRRNLPGIRNRTLTTKRSIW